MLVNLQLILVVSILAGGRVAETFTSSDFTVPKAYLVFVLVFVALTSIAVSSRFRIVIHRTDQRRQSAVLTFHVVLCNLDVYGLDTMACP